jgi:hypothetical protein
MQSSTSMPKRGERCINKELIVNPNVDDWEIGDWDMEHLEQLVL